MRWLKIVAGNLLVFGIAFGVLEAGTRWVAPEYANAYFAEDVTRGHPIYLNNRWGHRVGRADVDRDFLDKGGMMPRVLFVGDSVTFGYGLPYEQSYHQVAARRLTGNRCNVQVGGLGRLHSNLPKLLASDLADFIWKGFRPAIFVYQFQVNDVPSRHAPKKASGDLTWRDRANKFRITYLNRSAFLKLVQSVTWRFVRRQRKEPLSASLDYAPDSDPVLFRKSWRRFEESVLEARQMASARGMAFHIMIAPEAYDLSASAIDNDLGFDTSTIKVWPAERVKAIAKRHDISVFDPTTALRRYRKANPGKRLYFPNDPSHPNDEGHALIGEAAAAYLRSLPGVCP